jgi:hypothetical protein
MKSQKFSWPWFALVLFIVSCGTTVKVTSDYDHAASFTGYKTFSIYDVKSHEGQVSPINADRITNSIRSELTKKGFTEAASGADLLINPVTIMKDKTSVTANSNYYGYGGMYRPYGYWGGGGMASGTTTYSTYDYKDGSLVIDIVDSKTQKLVWQGTGNAEIDKQPKNPDEFIANAVKKILSGFPPGSKK